MGAGGSKNSNLPWKLICCQAIGETRPSRVVVNDAICNQSTAFDPDQLFTFSLEPQGAVIGIGNCSAQLMIAFSTIHSLLDILPQGQQIDIVKEVERTENT